MRLNDKVTIITGAGSGQGRAMARRFAGEGALVVISDISLLAAEETAQLVRADGGLAPLAVQSDVADESSVKALIEAAVSQYGGLHILVNCAGRTGPAGKPTADLLTREEWDQTLSVNLIGAWLGIKYAAPAIRDSGGGSIINVASTAGLRPFAGAAPYCAAKAGVLMLTKTVALEYVSWGIRVNAICPGHIDTPMMDGVIAAMEADGIVDARRKVHTESNPMGRLGTPEEVADIALFLASDESSFMTGSYLFADGGYMAT